MTTINMEKDALGVTNDQKITGVDEVFVFPENFGALGNGVADDAASFQAALDSLAPYSRLYLKNGSTYRLVDGVGINVAGTTIVGGGGKILYPVASQNYFHCLRVNANDCTLSGVTIESPGGLSRDDTAFAILVNSVDNCLVTGCTIRRTGSAAIWVANATGVRITDNYIYSPLADGIHFSDGARNFTCSGNTITGTHDDAIAVVGDVPGDASIPIQGAITGNSIDGTVAGHGVALIACDSINVVGNTIRASGYAGVGSYFWQVSGAPVASDWANNCLIADNVIIAPGTSPLVADNNCGIFSGAFKNSTVRNNRIECPPSEPVIGGFTAPMSGVRVSACQGLTIEGNEIRNSLSYGVWSPDTNVNGAINHTELIIRANRFYNIGKEIVRIQTAATSVGDTIVTDNEAYKCAYDGGTVNAITIARTASHLLYMAGNRNIDGTKGFFFDTATCTNFNVSDNAPETLIAFNPGAVASVGSWTAASGTGRFVDRGHLRFFRVQVTITTKGSGAGCRIMLPGAMRTGSPPFLIAGRNVSIGVSLQGAQVNLTTIDIFTYNNTDPITGDGQTIDISGWYERA